MIYFVFESLEDEIYLNFVDCKDLNPSGIARFTASPLVTELRQLQSTGLKITFLEKAPKNKKYVIASGVAHSPDFWTGKFKKTPSKKTVFEFLNNDYLKDLVNERAFLLLDQSHEGYHELWLWEWFHSECEKFGIPPAQIIYVTGNLKSEIQYTEWAYKNRIKSKMKVVPYAHFEPAMAKMIGDEIPSARSQINYKKQNKENIKVYNCLQKRPRNHRAWMFNMLFENNLLHDGINSMNFFARHNSYMEGREITESSYNNLMPFLPMLPPTDTQDKIPEFSSEDCGNYLTNFNEHITLNSWLSIISEASFSDELETCFLSEKTFKVIACEHPFIIYGNKHSLRYLKTMGYKSFHPYINEDYDNLDTWDRIDAIVKEIVRIKSFSYKEKIRWYKKIIPILKHNKKTLTERKTKLPVPIRNLIAYVKD